VLGNDVFDKFPFLPGMSPMTPDLTEMVLNRTWRPMLSITGADGLPALVERGQRAAPVHRGEAQPALPPTLNPRVATES
jgi:hypothetical protein